MVACFRRVAEINRNKIDVIIDGTPVEALEGDTLLVVLMTAKGHVRLSEFGDGERAGFCMMGACQDCWVWAENGARFRACSTAVEAGMRLTTNTPEGLWPNSL